MVGVVHGTVLTFNSCTKCLGSLGMICGPIATQFPGHRCVDDLTTERSFDLRGSFMCLAYLFDILTMGVCETRHWQMSS